MRAKGILIGACAALVLAGTVGAAAWTYSSVQDRPVGTWHDAPSVGRTPVVPVTRWLGTSSFVM
jgi:lysyl endopeptidase